MEDVSQLVSIQKQAFERLYQLYNDDTSPYLRGAEEFERWFDRGHHVYKIYADGALAGGITVFDRGNDEYYLARIYILAANAAPRHCAKCNPSVREELSDGKTLVSRLSGGSDSEQTVL